MIRFVSRTGRLEGLRNVRSALSNNVHTKRLLSSSKFVPPDDTLIVNWGWTPKEYRPQCVVDNEYRTLNKFSGIYNAMNKLRAFNKLKGAIGLSQMLPDYTTDYEEAKGWVDFDETVYARSTLIGSGGGGITVVDGSTELPTDSELYVKGVATRHEYRIHVVGEQVLIQRKALVGGGSHSAVRNYDNGYTFINEFTMSDSLKKLLEVASVRAVKVLGLDFGAVDIVTTATDIYILEVNTAPGVSASTTIDFYANGILSYTEQE
jgi:hypothetical protein